MDPFKVIKEIAAFAAKSDDGEVPVFKKSGNGDVSHKSDLGYFADIGSGIPVFSDVRSKPLGGTYGELRGVWQGKKNKEINHIPPASINGLDRNDGLAIVMNKADHRRTASCGNSLEARQYREKQAELISQKKFLSAVEMDYNDIHAKFGNKYDKGFNEMLSTGRERGYFK